MAKTGVVTGNVKLRSGPGTEFEPPLAYLEPKTTLEILDEKGDWLHVKVQGKEGYVGRKYVTITEGGAAMAGSSAGSADEKTGQKKAAETPSVKPAGMPDEVWQRLKK
jgi:uncharacterized protein YraI